MMDPKAIIFLADGMADESLAELGGKTPLEAAYTPGMDEIARRGESGTFLTLPEGLPTSSDVANMSVLGFDPVRNYPGRGPIEAVAQGIALADDDVAWRCNLVSVSGDGVLLDYSSGHIAPEDAAILMRDLQKEFGSGLVTFHTGVSYRNLLVLHGKRFSSAIDYYKPDASQDIPVADCPLTAKDDSAEARDTVAFLNDLCAKCAAFLADHPVNRGKEMPANAIWPWSPGRMPKLPPFGLLYPGRSAAVISAVDVIKGIGRCGKMDVIDVPGATGFLDTNYAGKVEAALKAIETHDLVYLHVEAIDECSHLGDLKLKMQAIEDFDAKIVVPVLRALENRKINFAVLPDHPVPLKLRCHTTTPVPLAVCGSCARCDSITAFSEKLAPQGTLGFLSGTQLVRKLLEIE